jgi:hypothetical protein
MSIVARPSANSVIEGLGFGHQLPDPESPVDFENQDFKLMES